VVFIIRVVVVHVVRIKAVGIKVAGVYDFVVEVVRVNVVLEVKSCRAVQ
jgi:hypothetical protein